MTHYEVKRNIPFELKFLVIILILSILIVVLTQVKINVTERITESQPKTEIVEYFVNETYVTNVSVNSTKEVIENESYVLEGEPVIFGISGGNKYIYQKFNIMFNNNINYCVELEYKLYDGQDIINSGFKTVCFKNEKKNAFVLKNDYYSKRDNLKYVINLTKLPQHKREVPTNRTISVSQVVPVKHHLNKTVYVNETRLNVKRVNLVKWLLYGPN